MLNFPVYDKSYLWGLRWLLAIYPGISSRGSPVQIYDNQNIMKRLHELVNSPSLMDSKQRPERAICQGELKKDLLTKRKLDKLAVYGHKQ